MAAPTAATAAITATTGLDDAGRNRHQGQGEDNKQTNFHNCLHARAAPRSKLASLQASRAVMPNALGIEGLVDGDIDHAIGRLGGIAGGRHRLAGLTRPARFNPLGGDLAVIDHGVAHSIGALMRQMHVVGRAAD